MSPSPFGNAQNLSLPPSSFSSLQSPLPHILAHPQPPENLPYRRPGSPLATLAPVKCLASRRNTSIAAPWGRRPPLELPIVSLGLHCLRNHPKSPTLATVSPAPSPSPSGVAVAPSSLRHPPVVPGSVAAAAFSALLRRRLRRLAVAAPVSSPFAGALSVRPLSGTLPFVAPPIVEASPPSPVRLASLLPCRGSPPSAREKEVEKSGKNVEGDAWWETWQEVLHQDEWSNIARIERSAEKQAKYGIENAGWYEKWWEKYDAKGWTEKGAHKYGRLNEQSWWEKWGEHCDGKGSILKWTDKWAETEVGTKWGDKWEEKFYYGIGVVLSFGLIWFWFSCGQCWTKGCPGCVWLWFMFGWADLSLWVTSVVVYLLVAVASLM